MLHYLIAAVIDTSTLPKTEANNDAISRILQIVFGLTGSIAFLVVTIAGFRYVVSHGDPNQISQAKNAILYALVGLVISLAAFSIVTFVVGNI